jgi:Protein of unknown function (DUF2911)
MKTALRASVALALAAVIACAQLSPARQTSATINGKALTIRYSAPSVRGRKIFGPGGLLSRDPTYPAWRAGANFATSFHTDANLDVKGLNVPAGDYTIYVWIENPDQWQLILSKQTGQWGLEYNARMDLGRVAMDMSKPQAPIETYKMTLSSEGGAKGKLQLEWENHVASVPFTVK